MMNLIEELRITVPEHGRFPYASFRKLADELAIEIRPVWVKDPTKPDTDDLLRQLNALLEHSDAFFIHDWRYFQDQAIREKISRRIKAGIRVFVDTNSSTAEHESELNSFLSNYDAEATKIGVFPSDRPSVSSFEFIRDVHPECFRDSELFAGVAEFSVTQPRLIRYTGNTHPVAVIPRQEVMQIDLTTDLLHDDDLLHATDLIAIGIRGSSPTSSSTRTPKPPRD